MGISLTRALRVAVATAAIAALAAVPAALGSAQAGEQPAAAAENLSLWFVEMPSAPAADGTSVSTIQAEQADFRSQAKKAGVNFQERYSFKKLWNGVSIKVNGDASALSVLPSVKGVYPVGNVPLPAEDSVSPDLQTALAMTGADVAQNELGLTGAGVKVGVVDTGIDYNHPDLGGDGVTESNSANFPTGRVVAGYDFVGDAYDGSNAPVADPYPDDCNGHGTHVSGIIGANGTFATGARGVAPGVKFGAYRVFGCAGSANDDVILAALERAFADGMQVINMSLGDAFNNWPQAPLAQASDTLVNHGVVVVASIGNSGANGLYSAGAPGVGKKVIGVASYDNSHVRLHTFTVSPDNTSIGYGAAAGAPAPPTSGTMDITRTGTTTTTNDGCAALPAGSLTGEAVLIRRGTCTFYTKAFNAQSAGAIAVVLYNNVPGRVSPTVAGSPAITIPVVAVSDTEGALINGRIAAGPTTITWTNQEGTFPNPTGGLISSFSSFGLAADLSLKPDIGAPGGLIRSTWPLEQGSYATISGTSMSSPHVAGGVALLLQAKPKTSSNSVRSILQNSADPKNWFGNPGLGFLDNVQRQGAGMLDIPGAVLATTRIDPGKLSLGESAGGPVTQTLTVSNSSASTVTYDLSHVPALSTGANTFMPTFTTGFASVAFTQAGLPVSSVTVPGGGTASVDVTVTANADLPDHSLYGGYAVFTPQGGGSVYRVPYVGFKGDYQSIQVLTPTANNFPWLAKLSGTNFVNQPGGATYTFASGDVPYFLAHLDHQAQQLKAEVSRVSDGKNFGVAFNLKYLARNSTSTAFFAFPWDGKAAKGPNVSDVPNGVYTVTLTVTKALGTSAETETWTSPQITVARP